MVEVLVVLTKRIVTLLHSLTASQKQPGLWYRRTAPAVDIVQTWMQVIIDAVLEDHDHYCIETSNVFPSGSCMNKQPDSEISDTKGTNFTACLTSVELDCDFEIWSAWFRCGVCTLDVWLEHRVN